MPARSFVSHGVALSLVSDDGRRLRQMVARLPPETRARASFRAVDRTYTLRREGEAWLLYADRRRLARLSTLAHALDAFESHSTLFVAASAKGRLFIHAGVVGWRGQAIVIPGRSGAGKSTLVAALVAAGARYYSDEYALLDARGYVHAYRRPISLRRAAGRPRLVMPARVGKRPLPVGLVLVCRYRRGAVFAPTRLSPGRAVLALLKNTVPARAQAAVALERLSAIALAAPALHATRGEAPAVARSILDAASGR